MSYPGTPPSATCLTFRALLHPFQWGGWRTITSVGARSVCSLPKVPSLREDGPCLYSSMEVSCFFAFVRQYLILLTLGGWTLGNINSEGAFCTNMCKGMPSLFPEFWSISTGPSGAECVVVSVDYRLAPEHPYPEAVEDAIEALQWVWGQGAPTLGIDTKRIAVGGSSRYITSGKRSPRRR